MIEDNALQRCTIFLEKGRGDRPWRLSARSLNGSGLIDRYYGRSNRAVDPAEMDLVIAELTDFVREFIYIHGVQQFIPEPAEE